MALSWGLRIALRLIRNQGFTKGMRLAKDANVPSSIISEARKMAFGNPKKYLKKSHPLNKSALQKKIEKRRRN